LQLNRAPVASQSFFQIISRPRRPPGRAGLGGSSGDTIESVGVDALASAAALRELDTLARLRSIIAFRSVSLPFSLPSIWPKGTDRATGDGVTFRTKQANSVDFEVPVAMEKFWAVSPRCKA